MAEQGKGRAYHFRRSSMIWLALPVAAVIGLLWFITARYIIGRVDAPTFNHPDCTRAGCIGDFVIDAVTYLFLLVPLWVKLPLVAILGGEALARLLAPLVWTFDRTPDFSIGPEGVYGPCGLVFERVPWTEVSSATRQVYVTYAGIFFGLDIATTRTGRAFGLLGLGRTRPVTLRLRPLHGFPLQEIVDQIRIFAPDVIIYTEETEYRRRRRIWF